MPVVCIEYDHRHNKGNCVAGNIDQLVAEHALDSLDIRQYPGHNPAVGMGFEVTQRQPLQVAEKLLADIEDHAVADDQQYTAADVADDIAGCVDTCQQPTHQQNKVPDLVRIGSLGGGSLQQADGLGQLVNDPAPDRGQQHIGAGGKTDQHQCHQHLPPVAADEF